MFLIAVAILLSFVLCTKGAPIEPPASPVFPMGSETAVTNYCVSKVTYLDVVFYKKVGNAQVVVSDMQTNRTFASKSEIDILARDYAKGLVIQYLSTNGSKQGEFIMTTIARSALNPSAAMLVRVYPFTFPQSKGGGNIEIPLTFTDMTVELLDLVPYSAPGVRQAILQSENAFDPLIVCYAKTSMSSEMWIDQVGGIIHMPVYLVTDPERTNRLTISTSVGQTKSFKVYDRQGYLRPERLPIFGMKKINPNTLQFNLEGGEAGRQYKIQQTTNSVNWTNSTFIFPVVGSTNGWKTNFNLTINPSTSKAFFRVAGLDSWLP